MADCIGMPVRGKVRGYRIDELFNGTCVVWLIVKQSWLPFDIKEHKLCEETSRERAKMAIFDDVNARRPKDVKTFTHVTASGRVQQ